VGNNGSRRVTSSTSALPSDSHGTIGRVAISTRSLVADERVVTSTRPHVKRLLGPILMLLALCWATGFLLAGVVTRIGQTAGEVLIAFALLAAWWYVIRPFLRWLSTMYTLTNQRMLIRTGVLRRTGRDVWLQAVTDVSCERGLTDRLFGSGTLVIADASGFRRAVLSDVPTVRPVRELLDHLIQQAPQRHVNSGEGASRQFATGPPRGMAQRSPEVLRRR
jgi:uncharacterized membrane protein YdbT with pleckstrin-like domain